jgi:transketolase
VTQSIDMRDAFFDKIYDLAEKDKNVVFLAADHGAFSLVRLKKDLPDQYINLGISEQNMVSVAAGLALSGKKVFIYAIVNFVTLRCLEQIYVDISGMNLPVTIIGVGAGFTYATDGPTHHGVQDIAAMAPIPNLSIFNSSDAVNTSAFAEMAYNSTGPTYIRIEKGGVPQLYEDKAVFDEGLSQLKHGEDLTIIATGNMVSRAMDVATEMKQSGYKVGVVDLYRIQPINEDKILSLIGTTRRLVTLEEHVLTGGIGSLVNDVLCNHGISLPLKRIGVEDQHCFYYSNSRENVQKHYHLDQDSIIKTIDCWLNDNE